MYVRSCFAGFDFIFDNFGVNAFALALYFPLIFFHRNSCCWFALSALMLLTDRMTHAMICVSLCVVCVFICVHIGQIIKKAYWQKWKLLPRILHL